jgi:hypothetical protein
MGGEDRQARRLNIDLLKPEQVTMQPDYCFGLTATRHGMSREQRIAFGSFLAGTRGEMHHGLCVGGDADGHGIARGLGYWIIGHPPTDPKLRADLECDVLRPAKPYLVRNKDIVDETIALIACPSEPEEQPRGGTWSTVRYARKVGRPIVLILPNGQIIQRDYRATSSLTSKEAK